MADGLWNRVIDAVVKGVVTAVTGGGIAQVFGVFGVWFGRLLISAYAQTLSLVFVDDRFITRDLYAEWSRNVFVSSFAENLGIRAGILLLVLLGAVFHVLYKRKVAAATSAPSSNRLLVRYYVRFYFAITVALFLAGVVALNVIHSSLLLVAVFILLVIPQGTYVILYSRDLVRGTLKEQFCFVSMLLFFALSLLLLPHGYGKWAFDLALRPVTAIAGESEIGNVFVFDEKDSVLCRVTPADQKFSLLLFKKPFSAAERQVPLRLWVANYSAPSRADTSGVLKDFRTNLTDLVHSGGHQ